LVVFLWILLWQLEVVNPKKEVEVLFAICLVLTVHRRLCLKTEKKEEEKEKTMMRVLLFHHHCIGY